MSDEPTQASMTQSEREKLGERLEKAAAKFEAKKRESFVDAKSLCNTCRWAFITRQGSRNTRQITCQSGYAGPVPEDIIECSNYSNITELSLAQMADIAYLIDNRTMKNGGYL